MSVRDTSLDPKIAKHAKNEFLKKGFRDASLREIAKNAGVTTGAIYKRYKSKDELFDSLVKPAVDSLHKLSKQFESNRVKKLMNSELEQLWNISSETHAYFVSYLYDNYDEFKLLLSCSEGSKTYASSFDDFVALNTEQSYQLLKKAYKLKKIPKLIGKEDLHIFLTAYWSCIAEPLKQNFSRERAIEFSKSITIFFNWKDTLGF